jgi:hypothetical protein
MNRILCKKCGNAEGEHSIARPDEILTLRSLGYEVWDCDSLDDITPLLEGPHRWVWVEKDGLVADSLEIEEVCRNADPDDPCDSDYMKDISS